MLTYIPVFKIWERASVTRFVFLSVILLVCLLVGLSELGNFSGSLKMAKLSYVKDTKVILIATSYIDS